MQQPPSPRVPFFKKGKSRPSTSRKRSPSPIHPTPASKSEVFHPSKKNRANLLSAGTKRTTSQRDDDDDNDNDLDNDKDGPDVKWTASGSHLNTALEIIAGDEVDAILAKRARKDLADAADDENERPDDGQYRGQQAYKSHLKKSKDLPKAMRVGPQRNTSTIRTVTIVDYQPDVCKDYKGKSYLSILLISSNRFFSQKPVTADSGTLVNSYTIAELVSPPSLFAFLQPLTTHPLRNRSRRLATRQPRGKPEKTSRRRL